MDTFEADDALLTILVSSQGMVKLFVDDQQIGYLDEVSISATLAMTPNVRVKFVSTVALPPSEEKTRLLERIHEYRELLARCPQVKVFEEMETLPRMMAVRPSSLPPPME